MRHHGLKYDRLLLNLPEIPSLQHVIPPGGGVFACRVVLCEQSSTKLDHFNLTRKMHTLSPQALSHTSSPTTHATQLHLSYLTHKAAYLSYLTHNAALWYSSAAPR